jgi:hypothetical protein
LQLEEDPELEEIEERIEQYKEETSEWKHKKTVTEKSTKGTLFSMAILFRIGTDS